MSDETEVTEEEKFASTEAIKHAEENGLTSVDIEELGVEPSSKEKTFTKGDVNTAIKLRDEADDSDDDEDDEDSDDDEDDADSEDEDDEDEEEEAEEKGEIYTYVGGGDESPRKINFMGRQEFVRGKATPVSDPVVLSKLEGHPTIIKGTVTEEELWEYDETARKEAEAQRAEDKRIEEAYKKKHK